MTRRAAGMVLHEWIAVAYFLYISIAALVRMTPRRAARVAIVAGAAVTLIAMAARADGWIRLWWPLVTILTGYWACGQTYARPMPRIEAWLQRVDDRVLKRSGALDAIARAPRATLEYLEAVYFACFLVIPGGLLALMATGHSGAAHRYWTAVIVAELGAFAVLPWVQTRPPWAIEPPGPLTRRHLFMSRLAHTLVDRATIRVNTFPSAHAAATVAGALVVFDTTLAAGALFLFLALSIVMSTVVGRYHFVVDAVTGTALGIAAWRIA